MHVLVIANETVASETLIAALRDKDPGETRFTVIAPVSEPAQGYVVYEDTRRAAAGRRLDATLKVLREVGFSAQGFVVETGPVQAAKDALAQLLDPPVDDVAAQPARRALRVGRDDDLGRRRLELSHRVADGVDRVRLDDEALGEDAGLP